MLMSKAIMRKPAPPSPYITRLDGDLLRDEANGANDENKKNNFDGSEC